MRIDIEGTTFCVSGNFQNFQNTRTVEAKLKAQGGKTSKSMGVKTQVLIALRQLDITDFDAYSHAHVICLRERMKSRLVMSFLDLLPALCADLAAQDGH